MSSEAKTQALLSPGSLISSHEVRELLGLRPGAAIALRDFPSSVGRGGKLLMYDRAAVLSWIAARERARSEREQAKREQAEREQARQEEWERMKALRAAQYPLQGTPSRPVVDWASALRLSDRPGLDGIEISPAMLAAETRRFAEEKHLRWLTRREATIVPDLDARPDPVKLAKSEAINARLSRPSRRQGGEPKRAAAPITLPARVTEPGFRSARAPRLQAGGLDALSVGQRPNIAGAANPAFSAPITGVPSRMDVPTAHAGSAGG